MKRIPILAAKKIAEAYDVDQVVVYVRRVGTDPEPHGEQIITYGKNKEHCDVAAAMSAKMQEIMGWHECPKEIAKDVDEG